MKNFLRTCILLSMSYKAVSRGVEVGNPLVGAEAVMDATPMRLERALRNVKKYMIENEKPVDPLVADRLKDFNPEIVSSPTFPKSGDSFELIVTNPKDNQFEVYERYLERHVYTCRDIKYLHKIVKEFIGLDSEVKIDCEKFEEEYQTPKSVNEELNKRRFK